MLKKYYNFLYKYLGNVFLGQLEKEEEQEEEQEEEEEEEEEKEAMRRTDTSEHIGRVSRRTDT